MSTLFVLLALPANAAQTRYGSLQGYVIGIFVIK